MSIDENTLYLQSLKSDNDRAEFLDNFKDIFDTIKNGCPHEIQLEDDLNCGTPHTDEKCLNCWRLALDSSSKHPVKK